ncbi:variant erythrocyte surface antigen-1 family protein [Babesia caballi]|uniref:Variant erythrocyte surface antigen-1 family protein n=1 Tax=Babesia caballi TaxID=5871 RepID=A0AAV4LNI6_BABCB|nr:variant erythrocyte surface antigen-1 family protein [Babesia caballi]
MTTSSTQLKRSLTEPPTNLKEAIDWILRVTGKDGQDKGGKGEQAIKALTEEVKNLLQGVKGSDPGLSQQEFEQVTQALGTGSNGLITKLAEGLQQFIGYQNSSFESYRSPKITGAGIAPSNIATHRLCDAAIAFTIGVLEGCKGKTDSQYRGKIDGVIKTLHGTYGAGPDGLQGVATQVKSGLQQINSGSVRQFLQDIGTAFEQKLNTGLGGSADDVATKVGEYLKGVFNGTWGNDSDVASKLTELLSKAQVKSVDNTYDPMADGVSKRITEIGKKLTPTNRVVKPILEAGKEEFVWHLEKAYVSYYQEVKVDTSQWEGNQATEAKKCAQIFLGCIPLIYQCLTQLYWLCHDKGPWAGQRFHDPNGSALRNIMVALGYSDYYLNSQQGKIVVKSAMQRFNEFTSAQPQGPYPQLTTPYHAFLNTLTSNFETAIKPPSSNLSGHTIPALYHIARLYFRHQHTRNADKRRPPSSIREMLYWLSGLQFSPQYDSLQSHISSVFKNLLGLPTSIEDTQLSLPVADSGATKDSNNTLSAIDLKGYLTMTCLYSPMVLGRLQGPGVSKEGNEPYLHYLFGNGMSFAYPSGAALLSKLSEHAYALQFQLSFLTQQCFIHNGDGCGWRKCKFGSTVEPTQDTEAAVSSHLCHADCDTHSSGACKHGEPNSTKCGQSGGKASPLQAFLTDKLHGFRRGHPGTSDHLASCSAKSMCHVPMGFKAEYLRETPGYGYHVFYPLLFYCSDHTRPLRLLSDKLHCISNYTPRSLGDMLGFYLHLSLQVFNKRPDNFTFPSYIADLLKTKQPQSRAGLLIFESLEESIVELGSALHGVIRHCHNRQTSGPRGQIKHLNVDGGPCSHSTSTPADLWSLFSVMDNNHAACQSAKCGAYLSPLTRSNGSTFGKSAGFASTYLSWVSYLADDFKERLEGLLNDFSNVTCTDCRTANGGTCNCTKGQHGTSSCQCDSVVSCSGVLPVLYGHGFNFFNVKSLSGKVNGNNQSKRSCNAFATQLQNVINGDPLYTLLVAVDIFLFAIRWEFFSKLSGFWTIYVCLILYTFFFLLDTLHVRSHLKLTASHAVPPLVILTSGQPLPIRKLTYITQ